MLKMVRLGFAVGLTLVISACGVGGGSVAPLGFASNSPPGIDSSIRRSASSVADDASVAAEMPRSTLAFVDSVGIVTHFHYQITPYVRNYAAARDLLIGLGVHHIRDGIVIDTDQAYRDALTELATYGIHTDGVASMNQPVADVTAFVSALPHVVESIEGPNEWNLSGDPNWAAQIEAYQKVLFAGVKKSPVTASLPVIEPSLTSYKAFVETFPRNTFSRLADTGNIHDYFGDFNPGTLGTGGAFPPYGYYGTIPFWTGIASYIFGSLPIECTETGWDDGSAAGAVSASVQARYTMRVLLEHWNDGVTRTYLYELLDEGTGEFAHHGLLTGSLAPKPVYRALKNMLAQLGGGTPPALNALTYSLSVVSGASTVHHTLLQRGLGKYNLLLWNEVRATATGTPTQVVKLTFAAAPKSVTQIQWLDDGGTVSTVHAVSAAKTVSLNITDRVSDVYIKQ